MKHPDPVLARLAALPPLPIAAELTERVRRSALLRLRPRRVPAFVAWLVACSTLGYLAAAVYFVLGLGG